MAGAGGLLGLSPAPAILAQGGKVIAADINVDAMGPASCHSGCRYCRRQSDVDTAGCDQRGKPQGILFHNKNIWMGLSTRPIRETTIAHFFDVSLASFNENVSLHLGSAFLFTQQCALYFKAHKTAFSLVNICPFMVLLHLSLIFTTIPNDNAGRVCCDQTADVLLLASIVVWPHK